MKNAVIYARYSSDKQREESISAQIRECTSFAIQNGYKIIGEYVDRAMTGKTSQRPQFLDMIKQSQKQKFQYVIVYRFDRFSRNSYDNAIYEKKLNDNGVTLVSATERIPTDPSGILLKSVIIGLNEYYSVELSEKVLRGQTQNALELKWPGGVVPLGYKLDSEKHIMIDESKAFIVKDIFDMFLNGLSVGRIATILNENHYTTTRGGIFKRNHVYSILHNERYTGVFSWKDIKKPDAIPPIISKEVFFKVSEKIKTFKKKCTRDGEKYMFSGKVYCKECGQKMVGTGGKSRSGQIYHYYSCPNKKCPTKNIRTDILEGIIYHRTNEILSDESTVAAIAKQAVAIQPENEAGLKVQALKNSIKDTEKKIDNCIKAIENGISSESLANTLNKNEALLEELKIQLSKAEILAQGEKLTEEKIRFFFSCINKKSQSSQRYRTILFKCFIRRILISNDIIEIQYNYNNELECSNLCNFGGTICHKYEHFHLFFTRDYFFTLLHRL